MTEQDTQMTPAQAWEIARADGCAQAEMVRSGEIAPDAPVEAAIARIEALDGPVNAVTHRAFDHARTAVGKIPGGAPRARVPYLLKASCEYPGFPVASGSRAKRDTVATRNWPLGARFDAAGLVPVGMSAMPEFGLLATGESLLYGPTCNPWDLGRSAGGSSSGAAAAVAMGLVPFAHASDAAGSIRMPASNCGIIGFKASRGGNVRARAQHWIDDTLCSDGLFARSMRDTAWAARFVRPAEARMLPAPERRLRIALDLKAMHGGEAEPAVAEVIRRAAQMCEALGHAVVETPLAYDRAAAFDALGVLWPYLGGDLCDGYSALHPDTPLSDLLEPWTIGLRERRATISPHRLAAALGTIGRVREQLESFHRDHDVVLSPVTRTVPPKLGTLAPDRPFDQLWDALFDYMSYTPLQNIAGTPSITLPLATAPGNLPVGALFSAAPMADEMLLALGAELEGAFPWADRWPPAAEPAGAGA
ncbi:amidase family protein [Stakelama tenebrarum]|uniref:Amidase n=1 Tax=Stakelama tenebrarum TaxID=2711215 RepID=A0A6G6Y455_9SPHN|nr:amidase family protein [Sphingosinithalassobacter tenebrarum]QIG79393.1 amidase [Sphingosinithalassobacter tenebrarum]